MSEEFWEIQPDNLTGSTDFGGLTDQPRILLPISLAIVVFFGATMPWIVIRPLGNERNSYNLTDIPGGIGILVTIFVLVLGASVTMFWKRVTGMVMLSLSLSILGWLAGISGMLLGIVSSFIPAIEVAGIDLSKAQVGQGSGVVITVIFNLFLAFLCVRQLEPFSRYSTSFEFPVIQLTSLVPAVLLTLTIHQGWLILGNPDSEWRAEVPGDSLYGSGLLVVGLWVVIAMWLTGAVLRTPLVIRIAGAASLLVSIVTVGYAFLVWVGGKALAWLLPGSVEGWASVKIQPSLYATALAGIAIGILGILGIVTASNEKVVRMKGATKFGSLSLPTSDLFAYVLLFFTVLSVAWRTLT